MLAWTGRVKGVSWSNDEEPGAAYKWRSLAGIFLFAKQVASRLINMSRRLLIVNILCMCRGVIVTNKTMAV